MERPQAGRIDTSFGQGYPGRMDELMFLVEMEADGGYVASAVGHSIVTQANTEQELHAMVRDAVRCHFDDNERPKLIRLHFVRDEVIAAE